MKGDCNYLDNIRKQFDQWLSTENGQNHRYCELLAYTPDLFELLCLLTYEQGVSDGSKATLSKAIAYFILPFDLIPEAVLGPAGYVDDIVISAFALRNVIENDGESAIHKCCKDKASNILRVIHDIDINAQGMVGENILNLLKEKLA